jgi:hypothetical protein
VLVTLSAQVVHSFAHVEEPPAQLETGGVGLARACGFRRIRRHRLLQRGERLRHAVERLWCP